jgi:Flp pilus assembly protein TadG
VSGRNRELRADRLALRVRRLVEGFPAVFRSTSRELRGPSLEGAQSSRRRGRLRGESGQGAVEFALVVPLLLLIIIAIFHFGKVMNYWLDLNHVASEGARKAAVNTYASDAEYEGYLRDRLETGELRNGGTTSIPTPATIAVCLPDGSEVGDPVTVQVAAEYSLPFIGTTIALRGTATMRLEQPADYAGGGACA